MHWINDEIVDHSIDVACAFPLAFPLAIQPFCTLDPQMVILTAVRQILFDFPEATYIKSRFLSF